jgi:hypothetical protein
VGTAFNHAELFTRDLYEDLLAKSAEVTETITGHTVAFNCTPHSALLLAVMKAIMSW